MAHACTRGPGTVPHTNGRWLVFDAAVEDVECLIAGAPQDARVVRLAPGEGLERVALEAAASGAAISELHVFAHGRPGAVLIGNGELSAATWSAHAPELAALRPHLQDGELFLWSCATGSGAAGADLVQRLEAATGARVSAAAHVVGCPARGGNWSLGDGAWSLAPPLAPEACDAWAHALGTFEFEEELEEALYGEIRDRPEGDSGVTEFIFKILRSGDASSSETVHVEIDISKNASQLWAVAGPDDFVGGPAPGPFPVFFDPGQTEQEIGIPVIGDGRVEKDETFGIHLVAPSPGAEIGVISFSSAIIRNDDKPPDLPATGNLSGTGALTTVPQQITGTGIVGNDLFTTEFATVAGETNVGVVRLIDGGAALAADGSQDSAETAFCTYAALTFLRPEVAGGELDGDPGTEHVIGMPRTAAGGPIKDGAVAIINDPEDRTGTVDITAAGAGQADILFVADGGVTGFGASPVVGDFDGDGTTDIAVTANETVHVLFDAGAKSGEVSLGSLGADEHAQVAITTGFGPRGFTVADLDGDVGLEAAYRTTVGGEAAVQVVDLPTSAESDTAGGVFDSDDLLLFTALLPDAPFNTAGDIVAADTDGDGISEIFASASAADLNGTDSGAVFRFDMVRITDGAPPGPVVIDAADDANWGGGITAFTGPQAGGFTGGELVSPGDVNGDGGDDILIGGPGDGVLGGVVGLVHLLHSFPDLMAIGEVPLTGPGWTPATPGGPSQHVFHGSEFTLWKLGGGGDLDGDGYNDFAVGHNDGFTGAGVSVIAGGESPFNVVRGTGGADDLAPPVVLHYPQRILARGGDDTVVGSAAPDDIRAGSGDDLVLGGPNDRAIDEWTSPNGISLGLRYANWEPLAGGLREEELRGNGGDDTIVRGPGMTSVLGGAGNDVMGHAVGLGNGVFNGGGGKDELIVAWNNNHWSLRGLSNVEVHVTITDTVTGVVLDSFVQDGADDPVGFERLEVRRTEEITYEGGGRPEIFVIGDLSGTDISDNTLRFTFRGGGDVLEAADAGKAIVARGGAGDDVLVGSTKDDRLFGGAGNDSMEGGAGHDHLSGQDGRDHLEGGDGDDTVQGGSGRDIIRGGDGRDDLDGGRGSDTLFGQRGRDTLDGGGGHDFLVGGADRDILFGRAGHDILNGGGGRDRLAGGGGHDDLRGTGGRDVLRGGGGEDTLDGGNGNDRLVGNGGPDTFVFGPGDGNDTIRDFEDGPDQIDLSAFDFTGPGQARSHAANSGGDVVFDFGADGTLVVEDILKNQLTGADFIL